MTALVSMFNFLIIYFRFLIVLIFGGKFSVLQFSNLEQQEIVRNMIIDISHGAANQTLIMDGIPILYLPIGIFVIGAVIGLARRLIRG